MKVFFNGYRKYEIGEAQFVVKANDSQQNHICSCSESSRGIWIERRYEGRTVIGESIKTPVGFLFLGVHVRHFLVVGETDLLHFITIFKKGIDALTPTIEILGQSEIVPHSSIARLCQSISGDDFVFTALTPLHSGFVSWDRVNQEKESC